MPEHPDEVGMFFAWETEGFPYSSSNNINKQKQSGG
jgi:hypothetical protein